MFSQKDRQWPSPSICRICHRLSHHPQAAARLQAGGHILLRRVARPEEFEPYRPFIAAAVERFRKEHRRLDDRDTCHKAFLQVANLWELDEAVKRFVFARRFAKIAPT